MIRSTKRAAAILLGVAVVSCDEGGAEAPSLPCEQRSEDECEPECVARSDGARFGGDGGLVQNEFLACVARGSIECPGAIFTCAVSPDGEVYWLPGGAECIPSGWTTEASFSEECDRLRRAVASVADGGTFIDSPCEERSEADCRAGCTPRSYGVRFDGDGGLVRNEFLGCTGPLLCNSAVTCAVSPEGEVYWFAGGGDCVPPGWTEVRMEENGSAIEQECVRLARAVSDAMSAQD